MLRIILASSTVALIAIAAIVYVFSKSKVVDEMIDAAHRADVAAFSSRIDWAGAREYAKADLAKQKGGIGGDQMGPAKTEIPPVVDYYMQPANLDILFYLREELFPNIPEKDFIQSISYSPPYGFTVTVGLPKTVGGGEIPEALRGRIKTHGISCDLKHGWMEAARVHRTAVYGPAARLRHARFRDLRAA